MEQSQENPKKTKLALKSFVLGTDNSRQLILAHKQFDENEHFVFTQGENANDKLRCFRLTQTQGANFQVYEVVNPQRIAEIAQFLGVDEQEIQ